MKILWLSHLIPYPPKGGVLQRSYHLLKELARYHDVDLLAFNQRGLIGPLFDSVETGITEADTALANICRRHRFFEIPTETSTGGKYWLALKSLTSAPYNINWLKSAEFSRAVKEWTAEHRYDLVHFDTISLIPFLSCIPPGAATVLDHHNIESHMLYRRAANENSRLKRVYFLYEAMRLERYERQYCPKFDLNITCSDVDTDRLRKLAAGSLVATIPNGVDLDYFRPGADSPVSPPRLIFVGTMSWYPNIEAVNFIADKLWQSLREKYPNLCIDIVGANPPEKIKNLERTHPGFKVHGFVDDVRPYLDRASIYLCPIRDGGGTKLKILDAMAMAKPLVTHPIACEGIAVTPEENVLFADTPDQFIDQISCLLTDSDRGHALGIHARSLIKANYSYASIGKQLAETYEGLQSATRHGLKAKSAVSSNG